MKTIFLILGGLLTIVAVIPYLIDILKKQTKPRIVTWFNWGLLTGIATAAAISDKQYPSAVLTFAGALSCAAVVALGLKHGDRKFELFDVVCQIGALLGLILWIVFSNPLLAIIVTVAIDFVAALPTLKHSWQKPYEETTSTYVITAAGTIFTLAAVQNPHFSGLLFPTYVLILDVVLVVMLLTSPNRHVRGAS